MKYLQILISCLLCHAMANPHFQLVWIERLRLRSQLGDLLIKVWRKSSRLEVGKYQRRNLPAAVDIPGRVLIHVVDLQGVLRDGDAQLQPLRALLNLLRLHRHHCDVPVLRLPEMFKTYVLSNFHIPLFLRIHHLLFWDYPQCAERILDKITNQWDHSGYKLHASGV